MIQTYVFKCFFESEYSVSVNNIDRQTVPQRRCSDAERSLGKFSARSRYDQADDVSTLKILQHT